MIVPEHKRIQHECQILASSAIREQTFCLSVRIGCPEASNSTYGHEEWIKLPSLWRWGWHCCWRPRSCRRLGSSPSSKWQYPPSKCNNIGAPQRAEEQIASYQLLMSLSLYLFLLWEILWLSVLGLHVHARTASWKNRQSGKQLGLMCRVRFIRMNSCDRLSRSSSHSALTPVNLGHLFTCRKKKLGQNINGHLSSISRKMSNLKNIFHGDHFQHFGGKLFSPDISLLFSIHESISFRLSKCQKVEKQFPESSFPPNKWILR